MYIGHRLAFKALIWAEMLGWSELALEISNWSQQYSFLAFVRWFYIYCCWKASFVNDNLDEADETKRPDGNKLVVLINYKF